MKTGRGRTMLGLLVIAVMLAFPLNATAVATAHRAPRAGISLDDAHFYLDAGNALPGSFRRLSPQEVLQNVGEIPADSAVEQYMSDEAESAVLLTMRTAAGTHSRALMYALLEDPEALYSLEDLKARFTNSAVSADQVSVSAGDWTDVAVGDRAKSALFTISIAGDAVIHFEMLFMLVQRGDDTASIEVMQVFARVPTVDVTEIARMIAKNIHAGPPTPEQVIAQAGLVTLADLPAGWQEAGATTGAHQATGTPETSTTSEAGGEGTKQVATAARTIPACRGVSAVLDAGSENRGKAASKTTRRATESQEGPQLRREGAAVRSRVRVYPTASGARAFFDLLRNRSITSCLTKLYRKITTDAIRLAGAKLPPAQQRLLAQIKVTVARAANPGLGDDSVLHTITVDLRPLRDVQLVAAQQYVRVGRAVGVYTFTGNDAVGTRESALTLVTARLAAALTRG